MSISESSKDFNNYPSQEGHMMYRELGRTLLYRGFHEKGSLSYIRSFIERVYSPGTFYMKSVASNIAFDAWFNICKRMCHNKEHILPWLSLNSFLECRISISNYFQMAQASVGLVVCWEADRGFRLRGGNMVCYYRKTRSNTIISFFGIFIRTWQKRWYS